MVRRPQLWLQLKPTGRQISWNRVDDYDHYVQVGMIIAEVQGRSSGTAWWAMYNEDIHQDSALTSFFC